MAIKFFLIYIIGMLAGSVAILAVARSFVSGFSGKRPVVYGVVSSAITGLVAYATLYIIDNLFTIYWVLAGIFLLFGTIHMLMMHERYFLPREGNKKILIGEVFFAISVLLFTTIIFSSLLYFLRGNSFMFYPILMSGLFFFVPLLVSQTFSAAYSIPPAKFTTWRYPVTKAIELPDENANERLLVIGFEIAKRNSDYRKTYFRARALENLPLGELYYHFINDYNELQSETPIEFLDGKSAAHEWWFRKKPKWYEGQRILDPGLTIKENGIKENTVIICERIVSPN